MIAAALDRVKAELGMLSHKGALITDQFQMSKTRAKHGVVAEKGLGLPGQSWALRCDGTSDEQQYTGDIISNEISEIPPVRPTSSKAAVPAQAPRAQSVPQQDPHAAVAPRADFTPNGATLPCFRRCRYRSSTD